MMDVYIYSRILYLCVRKRFNTILSLNTLQPADHLDGAH